MNIDFYKEQLEAKEDMLARTSQYLKDISLALEDKNNKLIQTNYDLFESIRFAQIIQSSLLPNSEVLKVFFKDATFSVQQQIGIGGDSIFIKNMSQGVIFGLMDCTGHGIPAAMLSISGSLILNELAALTEIENPCSILTLLSYQLNNTFNSKGLSVAHMEGTMFHYSTKQNKLTYCSAKGKAFCITSNRTIHELTTSKFSIGENIDDTYELFELEINKGDKLFLYSDGLTDQFGGSNDKKFSKAKLKDILLKNCHLNVSTLKAEVLKEHANWKNSNTQTDDVSFMIIEF